MKTTDTRYPTIQANIAHLLSQIDIAGITTEMASSLVLDCLPQMRAGKAASIKVGLYQRGNRVGYIRATTDDVTDPKCGWAIGSPRWNS